MRLRDNGTLGLLAIACCLPVLGPVPTLGALLLLVGTLLVRAAETGACPSPRRTHLTALLSLLAGLLLPPLLFPRQVLWAFWWLFGVCFLLAAPLALKLYHHSLRKSP